jgi:hypothetical protein
MRGLLKAAAVCLAFAGGVAKAEAYPVLQLDIVGGYYDSATQTIMSTGPEFQLVALLTPKPNTSLAALLAEKYFISVALTPQTGPTGIPSLGSFSWNGTSYDVTDDMVFGVPPMEGLEATDDPGDLPSHSVYPTFFREFEFSFSAAQTAASYDSATNPGGLSAGTGSYYAVFDIGMSLPAEYQLHFDLYNTEIRTKCSGKPRSCLTDEDIDKFAPFSHDAESGPPPVPEPASMLLLGTGAVAGALRKLRRRREK